MVNNYSIYEVTLTEIPTGTETQVCVTNCKDKAKLQALKRLCENYSFCMAELRKVTVTEYSIEADSFHEYWDSQLIDHRDIELQTMKNLHNAKVTDRIQNKYVIFSSNSLLKI